MRKDTIYIALIFIAVGTYCLLAQMSLGLPDVGRVWPILPFAAGVALLVQYFAHGRSDHGKVFFGTGLALTGLLFLLFTMSGEQPDYRMLESLWPAFVIIAGISFLALWLAQGLRDLGVLFLAVVAMLFGSGSLAVSLQLLGPDTSRELTTLWPVVPILVGLLLLLRGIVSGRRGA